VVVGDDVAEPEGRQEDDRQVERIDQAAHLGGLEAAAVEEAVGRCGQ
jgi:hypothetical protein